jgi:hypothetical protein
MPRHTLDSWVRKLRTIDVLLTKHKEEDIYNHMVKMYNKYQELFEKYETKKDNIMKEFDNEENHMYKVYNWKLGDPSRFWLKNADEWYLVDVPEDEKQTVRIEYMFFFFEIWADFMVCDKYSEEWGEEKPEWSSMVADVERCHGIIKNVSETIKLYEEMDFCKYKALFEKENKDWIESENLRKEHKKNHPKIELPNPTNLEKEPEPYPTEPLVKDCIHCKEHLEETKSRYDRAVELWLKNKQEDDDYKRQQELEDEKKRLKREKAVKNLIACFDMKEELDCDICSFTAKDTYELYEHRNSPSHKKNCRYCKVCNHQSRTDDEYDQHCQTLKHINKENGIEEVEKTKEDIKKSRYCEICSLQCRNDADYSHHLTTLKHKKNAGLIEKVKIYKCTHCDYQTTIKCNYEKHIVAKNHM